MDKRPDWAVSGLEEGLRGIDSDPKTAYFTGGGSVKGMTDYVALDMQDAVFGLVGLAFQKNSEFTDIFNFHLQKLEENGMLPKFHEVGVIP